MGFQVSPGVSIQERDLTTIIPAVASTPAGLVGQFKWGPTNQRIVVSSENDLVQLFGSPDINTFTYFYSASNFLQYGNNLQLVRGVSGGLNAIAGATAVQTGVLIGNKDTYDATSSWAASTFFAARYPGLMGSSLKIEVCDGATAFLTWGYSGQFSNAPGTSLYTLPSGSTLDELHAVVIDEDGVFTGATGTVLEVYEGLSKATDARKSDGTSNYFVNVFNNSSKYLWVLNTLTGMTTKLSTDSGSYGNISPAASYSGGTTGLYVSSFSGGTNGSVMSGSQIAALYQTYFADSDAVDVSLLIGGPLTGSAAATVADVAKARKDCVAFFSASNNDPTILDTVKSTNCTDLKTAIGENSYAFIDTGWKYQYDRYNDVFRWVPLNADIAGLCARTDLTNDPWWSPAGFNRGGIRNVVKLAFNPNQAYKDILYPKGINPVVTYPGQGTVLWGDRTAQTKPSAFDRINVRRLFIVLEKAIAIASKFQLFEFNDAFTRANFVAMVEPFLRDVQARRGIFDFKVVCDETNNTSEVIDGNRFVADIFIKPSRVINFIQLNFTATRTGVNFEEITSLTRQGF